MGSLKFSLPIFIGASILLISQGIWVGTPGNAAEAASNSSETADIQIARPSADSASIVRNNSAPKSNFVNDTYYDKQWSLETIRLPISALTPSANSTDVIVAVLDTGIDKNQEDLKGKVVGEIDLTPNTLPADLNGHGTFVSGIISASTNNGLGIAGIAPTSHFSLHFTISYPDGLHHTTSGCGN